MTMKVKKKSGRYFGDGGGRKSGLRPSTKSNPWELALQISSRTTRNNYYNAEQLVQLGLKSYKASKRLYSLKADKDTCKNYFKLVGHTKLLYKDMWIMELSFA